LYLAVPNQALESTTNTPEPQLPPRLAKIARLVISGCTDKQIASRTGLSFSTVRTYVRQIYRRIGVHSRVELVHASNTNLVRD
jgi:DNA-binding NarL/FixJ family response regulator